jgi:hypothetical protein
MAMLKVLVEAERFAVRECTHICNMTAGKDHRTCDLAQAILNEEIEHESWFSGFLGEGPSGHFVRRGETSIRIGVPRDPSIFSSFLCKHTYIGCRLMH